jgi:3-phenylpropionate/trans-cinnamate dioxygenase ferredoxin reductase component
VSALRRIGVVGGGLAGARSCEELRSQGFDGEVVLVGQEPVPPYDRPPLSKGVLLGAQDSSPLETSYESLDVSLRLGVRATGLRQGVLETDGGELAWDGLVLATGAAPVRLPGGPQAVLRTLEDALALREALRPGARVVVAGASWIGAEVTTAARARGCEVTVCEAGPAPLWQALGAEVGALTAGWYAEVGAELRTAAAVERIEPGGIVLAGGERLPADVVLTGVGVRPDVGWLAGSGLGIDRGVAVDETGRAAGLDSVVAVGDCAARWSPREGARLRAEHWDEALHAPAVAVATLLGRPAASDPVPYFWSDQFGRTLQVVGVPRAGDERVWRGDPTGQDWAVAWMRQGRLAALLAVGRPRDSSQARKLIARGGPVDATLLGDPAVTVRDAGRAA